MTAPPFCVTGFADPVVLPEAPLLPEPPLLPAVTALPFALALPLALALPDAFPEIAGAADASTVALPTIGRLRNRKCCCPNVHTLVVTQ